MRQHYLRVSRRIGVTVKKKPTISRSQPTLDVIVVVIVIVAVHLEDSAQAHLITRKMLHSLNTDAHYYEAIIGDICIFEHDQS